MTECESSIDSLLAENGLTLEDFWPARQVQGHGVESVAHGVGEDDYDYFLVNKGGVMKLTRAVGLKSAHLIQKQFEIFPTSDGITQEIIEQADDETFWVLQPQSGEQVYVVYKTYWAYFVAPIYSLFASWEQI